MIRFVGEAGDGKPLLGIGLSRANCEKLLQGQPIIIITENGLNGQPFDGYVLLMGGETEADMAKELKEGGFLTEETQVHETPRYQDGVAQGFAEYAREKGAKGV